MRYLVRYVIIIEQLVPYTYMYQACARGRDSAFSYTTSRRWAKARRNHLEERKLARKVRIAPFGGFCVLADVPTMRRISVVRIRSTFCGCCIIVDLSKDAYNACLLPAFQPFL